MSLTLNNISKAFGEKKVLKDISFSLKKETVTILVGANGCGKTTLFNIISGFTHPDKGNVYIDDFPIISAESNHSLYKETSKNKKNDAHEINRKGLSRTFQNLRLINELTVRENILLSMPKSHAEIWWKCIIPTKKVKAELSLQQDKLNHILDDFMLRDEEEKKAKELSFGQQKLLNLACCYANNKPILLLDEPVAGINVRFRDMLANQIIKIKKEGKTILIIEHNVDFINKLEGDVFFLNDGNIQAFSSYNEFKKDNHVQNAYV